VQPVRHRRVSARRPQITTILASQLPSMRTFLLTVSAIVLGVALGAGIAVLRIRSLPWDSAGDEGEAQAPVAKATPPKGPAPKVVATETEFDFGARDMEGSAGSHDFVITNAGEGPLTLSEGGTSCRCTMSKLGHEKLPPGGSTKVTITWKSVEKPGPYQQTAKILTNDPANPQITLTIRGKITASARLSPTELVFSRLSAGETVTGQSRLYSYLDVPLKLKGRKWSDTATAKHFDVATQPLTADELKEEPTARSGILVKVTVKPGLAQGPINQKLILEIEGGASLSLPITGIIGSEIALVGRGWDSDTSILHLGDVARSTGAQRQLMLVVRGPHRKEIKFKTATIRPDVLKVKLGQPSEINEGAAVRVPLTIDIPAGSPPTNCLGSEQGRLGEIILETTHPQVPKLRILVRFAIEG
jgi:hypothetical protein